MQLAPQPSKSVFRISHGHAQDQPVFFWRPFSNLPARHVLGSLCAGVNSQASASPRQALFLGCTDPRTIIKSLAMLQLDRGGQQLQLTAVLNDVHVPILARTALLLLMAAELDPNSKADMQLLYDVWFNTIWHSDTWPRFAAFTQRLINGSVPWLMPAGRQDQQQLQEVWRWWLDEKHANRPTPADVTRQRSAFTATNPVYGGYKFSSQTFKLQRDKYPAGFREAVKVLHCTDVDQLVAGLADMHTLRINYESTASKPPHVEQPRLALCAVLDGVTQHLQTGSLSWDGNRRVPTGTSNTSNLNITFTEPGTGAWNVHPDQQPFTCWGTYTAEELTTAMQAGLKSETALAEVFITRMASFVERFQRNTTFHARNNTSSHAGKPVALQVQLICGEALGLCLHDPFSSVSDKASIAQDSSSSSSSSETSAMPPLTTFDIIDTGSLCDDVGLLPLLVAVTPRLSKHPAARLHTVPATWTVAAPRMDYYLQEQALGMPMTMTPTLVGLRLITDINWGRPTSLRNLVVEAGYYDPRELSWAPVLPSQPRPRLVLPDLTTSGTDPYAYKDAQWGPPGSIGAVMQNVCKLCCTNNHHAHPHKYADVAVKVSTLQTFAWLLASCIPRSDMSSLVAEQQQPLSSSTGNSQVGGAAAALRQLWVLRTRVSALLPAHFRLAFQGAIDAVRASLQAATSSAAAVEAAGVPACNHQSFMMLPFPKLEHGEEAVDGGVRLRRPYVRALLGANESIGYYTLRRDRLSARTQEVFPGRFMPITHISGRLSDQVYEFAYEGSALDPPPKKYSMVSMVMGGDIDMAEDAADKELKVHVLDCCSVPYSKASGWRAAFMVPSDHASMQLPNETCMLVSVGPDYYGTYPPLKHKFMDIPVQAVSPVLAQCFLHLPATQTATEGSTCSPALQVIQLDETVWGYEVVLKLQGPGTPSGLSIALPQAATAKPPPSHTGEDVPLSHLCPSSHVVQGSLKEPAGVSTQLVLGWPVAAGLGEPEGVVDNAYSSGCGVTAKLKKSEKAVKLTLAKAQVWERWPEQETPPHVRYQLLEQHKRKDTLGFSHVFMHTATGSYQDMSLRTMETMMSRSPRNALRSFTMQMTFALNTADPRYTMFVIDANDLKKGVDLDRLFIMVSNDFTVDAEDGHRIIMPALVIDAKLLGPRYHPNAYRYLDDGVQMILQAFKLLDRRAFVNGPEFSAFPAELAIVRRFLWHNAQRWQPNEWQKLLLSCVDIPAGPTGPYVVPCFATYITPLFTEQAQQHPYNDVVFNELFPAGIPPLGQPLPYPLNTSDTAAGDRASAFSSGDSSGVANKPVAPQPPSQQTATPKHARQPGTADSGGVSTISTAARGATKHGDAQERPTHQASMKSSLSPTADKQSSTSAKAKAAGDSTGGKKAAKSAAAATASGPSSATPSYTMGASAGSSDGQIAMDHEAWVRKKMSELKVDFPHCTDEELCSMAEMAYGMHMR